MDITLDYVEITPQVLQDSLLLESVFADRDGMIERKWKLLSRLGITKSDSQTPLQAWVRYIHLLNGIEPMIPADPEVARAILDDFGSRKFMWWIS
jgi:hypothetical protein